MGSGKSGEEQCGRGQVATPDSDVAGGLPVEAGRVRPGAWPASGGESKSTGRRS